MKKAEDWAIQQQIHMGQSSQISRTFLLHIYLCCLLSVPLPTEGNVHSPAYHLFPRAAELSFFLLLQWALSWPWPRAQFAFTLLHLLGFHTPVTCLQELNSTSEPHG